MFRELIKKLSAYHITFETWILSVSGIICIRIFLEQYSNNIAKHFVLIDLSTIVQYGVSFLTILLSCIAIIMFFTKRPLGEIFSLTLFVFPIILTPPIFDLLLSHGKGYGIHYIFLPLKDLTYAFLTDFWSTTDHGMTSGIRIEILFLITSSFALIYTYTKNILRSLMGSFFIYLSIFVLVSVPSFLGILQNDSIPHFIEQSILRSNIINNSTFSQQLGFGRLLDIGFNSLMTQVNLMVALAMTIVMCVLGYKEKFKIILRNSRPERILHYSLLIVMGVILGGGKSFFYSWVNILSLCMTIIAFTAAWLAAVCINDIHDREIDLISNKNRPIPSGLFTDNEFRSLARIFLLFSLVSAYVSSLYGLFFVILFSFVYYLYSTEPLKFKRHFISGAMVIGIASVSCILSGFFLSQNSRELFSFPPLAVLTLVLLFGFSSMVKDLKDYEGDLSNGIKTLPVIIGLKSSKILIASIISLSMIGISLYLRDWVIIVASIITSIFVWAVLLAKNYKEKRFFIVYLGYLVVCAAVLLFR